MLDYNCMLLERLKRQRLLQPIESAQDEEEYLSLFKTLQPVAPVHFTRPGDPPQLIHRTEFSDYGLADELRKKHRIVKGRFLGGRVGYVLHEDLARYATAFRKKITALKPIHEDIVAVIKRSGGISKEQLKEELAYPAGQISKALIELQEAFLLYEDQTDSDWDTGWFDFASEWFELPAEPSKHEEAVLSVISNFVHAMVFVTFEQIKSWTQFTKKTIQAALAKLLEEGQLIRTNMSPLGEGYMRAEDDGQSFSSQRMPNCVFMMDKSDLLVRAYMSELQVKYKGREVLQYFLIDGEFKGAAVGHWRIGDYDIDDIILELDEVEADARKIAILDAARKIYSPGSHRILRYNGMEI